MKSIRLFTVRVAMILLVGALANSQTWTPLTHQPSFNASTALLLTDGTVMVQAQASSSWWRLTPDNHGSYVDGTWSQLASMPIGYGPLNYASAVLADGNVVIEGGEFNLNQGQVETNMGAIYNPTTNTWNQITAPAFWSHTGDAQSVVLADGTFMLGNCGFPLSVCAANQFDQALLDESTLTWTQVGIGKADENRSEGWTLLPSGEVLTIDLWNGTNYELYNPKTQIWTSGTIGVSLIGCSEIGPAVLRPNGTVFAIGGNGLTEIYNPNPFMQPPWAPGPSLPSGLGVADGPAALLPDGNVLVDASPTSPCFSAGSQFFEFNGTTLTAVSRPPRASVDSSKDGRMLVLPTGQILFTDGSNDVEVYTASGTYNFIWQPTLNTYPSNITIGASWYPITGTQFNGLSQGAMYGDDAQSATNYPLVRITNNTTGHVFYAFTHNHSSMGVATSGVNISTLFDPPLNMERGLSTLVVVANGIPSAPVTINVF